MAGSLGLGVTCGCRLRDGMHNPFGRHFSAQSARQQKKPFQVMDGTTVAINLIDLVGWLVWSAFQRPAV